MLKLYLYLLFLVLRAQTKMMRRIAKSDITRYIRITMERVKTNPGSVIEYA